MYRAFGAAALLSLAIAFPAQDAAAQDPVGGAILGGAAGAILGGALGGGRGDARDESNDRRNVCGSETNHDGLLVVELRLPDLAQMQNWR